MWIGINHVNRGVLPDRFVQLFQLQDELYATGARNFLFLNLPPFDRSPGGNYSTQVEEQISIWNDATLGHVANFTATHVGTTVFYSIHRLWDEFYADPAAFNITDPDVKGGGLWYDDRHPSTTIQEVIGQRFVSPVGPLLRCKCTNLQELNRCRTLRNLDFCTRKLAIHSLICATHNGRLSAKTLAQATFSPHRKQYVIGLVLLLVVVFEWTGSNFLTQDLFEDGYNKPFFVTYMNTASFSVYLIPALVRYLCRRRFGEKYENGQGYQVLVNEDEEPQVDQDRASSDGVEPLTTRETVKLAAIFCLFWFLANWAVNASLEFTSVASTTILASMSGFFTLLIGRLFHVESLSVEKIGAVVVSFVGCALVSLADTSEKNPAQPPAEMPIPPGSSHPQAYLGNWILGDLFALGSALFYALYVVLLKVRIGEESRIDMQLFFGFVGVFNVLACWPIGVILHLTGAETFELPSSRKAWYAVLLNMFITLSSDFIYVIAMLKTTPLVVTIGLSLTIPLAVGGDLFLGKSTSSQSLIGATLVLIAFIVIGLEDRDGASVTQASGLDVSSPFENGRGQSTERPNELHDAPPLNQSEDDEDLRRSVEAMLSTNRDRTRRKRSPNDVNDDQERPPLDRGRSRTRSGTFKRERVSGSLKRSEERRTRSRAGRKSSSDQDDKSRRSGRGREWDYGNPTVSDSEEHNGI
ncbi:hypothetical protein FRC10_002210 [Ceratobasidium sp. 414]|nr:hypothetical protein FRC10_002210 [Ceratobasidium sp. 414]